MLTDYIKKPSRYLIYGGREFFRSFNINFMEEVDQQFIEKKLDNVLKYREELEPLFKFSDEEIKKDNLKLRTVERLIQLIADEMVDINSYLIKKLNFPVPDDFQSTFYVLANNNILVKDFANKIAPIIGLRNRLVHRYEKVDMDLLLKMAREGKSDFKIYAKQSSDFLSKN